MTHCQLPEIQKVSCVPRGQLTKRHRSTSTQLRSSRLASQSRIVTCDSRCEQRRVVQLITGTCLHIIIFLSCPPCFGASFPSSNLFPQLAGTRPAVTAKTTVQEQQKKDELKKGPESVRNLRVAVSWFELVDVIAMLPCSTGRSGEKGESTAR
jgi:hypothetical protein